MKEKNRTKKKQDELTKLHSQISRLEKTKMDLKRKEEKLNDHLKKYRVLSRAAMEGIIIHDQGKILEANEAFAKILGYKIPEVIGTDGMEYAAPEYREIILKKIMSGYTKSYEAEAMRKDGSKFPVEIRGKNITYKGRTVRATSFRNITNRKQMENALKDSERFLKDIFNGIQDGISILDRDLKITKVNKWMERMYRSEKPLVGKKCYVVYQKRKIPCPWCPTLKTLKTGKPHTEIVPYPSIDQPTGWIELSSYPLKDKRGKVISIIEHVKDITEREITAVALKDSEEKYKNLFHSSNDAIFIHDLEGYIYEVNQVALDRLGYKKEELLHMTPVDIDNHEYKKQYPARIEKLKKRKNLIFESVHLRKDGTVIPVEISSSLINFHGKPAILSIARDISERKKADQLKGAMYEISEAAHSVENLEELYHSIHNTIASLMPAKDNFYIALYDEESMMLNFPYFIDEYEENPGSLKFGKGLTEYVIKTGRPLLASPKIFKQLIKKGEIESIGPPSIDWLGAPLKTKAKTIGVLAVQSYTDGIRYTKEDKNILTFITEQVAMAIERKQAEDKIKASLQEKEVMLREIHHRVKNNMQIISSLLRLQASQIKDKKTAEMFEFSQNRIKSMALIHESLYRSKDLARIDFTDYIKKLTTHLLSIYSLKAAQINLRLEVKDIYLDITKAIPCGFIVNELVTNSLLHAFPEKSKGEISIKMNKNINGEYILTIKDTGVGIPRNIVFGKTKTLGMSLVLDLVTQLGGTIKITREKGTKFVIKF